MYEAQPEPLIVAAAVKGLAKLAADSAIEPGTHPVDATISVRLQGVIDKGHPTEYTPTAEIPLLPTMALLLQKAGVTRDHARALLFEAAAEALAAGDDVAAAIGDRLRDAEDAIADVQKAARKLLPKKTRAGALRWNGVATVVLQKPGGRA